MLDNNYGWHGIPARWCLQCKVLDFFRGPSYESVTSGEYPADAHLMESTRSTDIHHAVISEKPIPPLTSPGLWTVG